MLDSIKNFCQNPWTKKALEIGLTGSILYAGRYFIRLNPLHGIAFIISTQIARALGREFAKGLTSPHLPEKSILGRFTMLAAKLAPAVTAIALGLFSPLQTLAAIAINDHVRFAVG